MQQEFHVAIIMDGNGRWATSRGLPRVAGHREGAKAVERVVEAAPTLGVTTLTLYAFSSDNWQRPASEVRALMSLLRRFLVRERQRCIDNGVRVGIIGRRDRLAPDVVTAIEELEAATRGGKRLHLRIALDYSARWAITAAAAAWGSREAPGHDEFARLVGQVLHAGEPSPDVDLLIRTSGEQRLSDFLLWECAYAELVFTPVLWPEFGRAELAAAVHAFQLRDRRFGRVSA